MSIPWRLFLLLMGGVWAGAEAMAGPWLQVSVLDEPPFFWREAGRQQGCDPAFYRMLGRFSEMEFALKPYPVNRLLTNFAQRRVQMMLLPSPDAPRPSVPNYEYFGPVLETRFILVGRQGGLEPDLRFVRGLRVGVPPSVCWGLCEQLKASGSSGRAVRSIPVGLELLEAGRLDLLLTPDLHFAGALVRGGWPGEHFVVRYREAKTLPYFLALSTDLPPELRTSVRLSLSTLGLDAYQKTCIGLVGKVGAGD